jgi:hypothetical protein
MDFPRIQNDISIALPGRGKAGAAKRTCRSPRDGFHSASQYGERIMAKGAMKAKKETRKPKKDAKKPAAAPALKAAPVAAIKQKEK